MLDDLEGLLSNNGVKAYTVVSNVMGKGVTGRVFGTFLNPDINAMIFAALPADQADKAISALQALHATRKAASRDTPIPLKVFSFSFPCEEHV
jgi:hypothetical protein